MSIESDVRDIINSKEYLSLNAKSALFDQMKKSNFIKVYYAEFYSAHGEDLTAENKTDLETALADYDDEITF